MHRGRSKTALSLLTILLLLSVFFSGTAAAQGRPPRADRPTPAGVDGLSALERTNVTRKVRSELTAASGPVQVIVRLSQAPVAKASDQAARGAAVAAEQDAVLARVRQIDSSAKVLGRAKILLNALMLEVDAARLTAIAQDARVFSINPIVNFELDLSETVPYIGATPDVQSDANGGAGVKVAVLDSGIDYTHIAFGGAGTLAAYEAAYGTSNSDPRNTTRDGLFPTAKVVAGYDFVGEAWPNGPLAPDEDPIDFEGHGTHVADIIAGAKGVAPAASLYAVKVCSAVSSSCSGVALLQGMEFSADPNQDGRTNDAVDIINMSLGSSYGDGFYDDLSTAVQNATDLGILTVASAGNSADRPYIVGTPSAAPSALSVAQTQVPSAKTYPLVINSPASAAGVYNNTATVDWAPIGAGFTGDVVFIGRGCPGDPLLANPAGKVALIDRGACAVSLKTDVAAQAGAIGVLIGLVAPGDASSFSFGGGTNFVPTLVITQAEANRIKANITAPVNVSVSDATTISLTGSMVNSSSRGPASGKAFPDNPLGYQFGQLIKPEIGAPGASVSAIAGSGSGTEAFGGTSGAAPMVAGAAALLIAEVNSGFFPPREIKARLMNTAETTVYTNPGTQPGVLAPITRIGNGEVRIDRAIEAGAAAWELAGAGASLSFGFVDVNRPTVTIKRTVEVKNYTGRTINYDIGSTFRYADDEANGAVSIKPARKSISVPAYSSRYFVVTLTVDGTKLRPWTMNSGPGGGSTVDLNTLEYDGYLTLTDSRNAKNNLHLAWHVLPRLSPQVAAPARVKFKDGFATVTVQNKGPGDGSYTPLSLIGENPVQPISGGQGSQAPNIAARYLGAATFPVPTAFCDSGLLVQFGVQTWTRVTHANYPLEIDIYLDSNGDGVDDHVIYTAELNLAFAGDGRNVVYAGPISGPQQAFFFTEHGTNSGSFVLTVCGEQVGLSSADAGRLVNVTAYTFDNYFLGTNTSVIPATMGVLAERYLPTDAAFTQILGSVDVAAGGKSTFGIVDFGPDGTSPTEKGLLLLNTRGGSSEALVITPRN